MKDIRMLLYFSNLKIFICVTSCFECHKGTTSGVFIGPMNLKGLMNPFSEAQGPKSCFSSATLLDLFWAPLKEVRNKSHEK